MKTKAKRKRITTKKHVKVNKSLLGTKGGGAMNVSKTDIIADVAHTEKVTQATAKKVIDSFIDSVKQSVKKGKSVTIVGLCSVKQVNRKARKIRSIQTGKIVTVPAKKVVKFKASGKL